MDILNPPEFVLIISSTVNLQSTNVYFLFLHTADPPRITTHPKDLILKDALLGEPVTFTICATGTEPSYLWWRKLAGEESEEWQLCPTEWSHGTTLKIPRVQKSDEGSYQCVVGNCAGRQTSKAAKLCIGKIHISANCMKHLNNLQIFQMCLRTNFFYPDYSMHHQE